MVALAELRVTLRLLLGNLSISRHGRSSVELVFSDDLKPDVREQSGMEQFSLIGKVIIT
jgi:hypothetical protein